MDKVPAGEAYEHFAKGNALVDSSNYDAAATEFAESAKIYENMLVQVYCAQAGALEAAERFSEAVVAAEAALRITPKNAKPWFRKGSALFKVGKRESAKKAFEQAATFEKVRALKVTYMDWAARCEEKTSEADEGIETVDVTDGAARVLPFANGKSEKPSTEGSAAPNLPSDKTRMEWYQSAQYVTIDIYAKNVIKEKSSVQFERSHIKVWLVRPDGKDYVLEKDLSEDIEVEGCTWSASRFKVDIRMKKVVTGSTWKALDKDAEVVSAAVRASADSLKRKEQQEARQQGWQAVTEKELKDYKEDDSSMSLFRQIYKDADEDTQRAMMKSYSESGGQVLSTNWDEVKKKKVTYTERD